MCGTWATEPLVECVRMQIHRLPHTHSDTPDKRPGKCILTNYPKTLMDGTIQTPEFLYGNFYLGGDYGWQIS